MLKATNEDAEGYYLSKKLQYITICHFEDTTDLRIQSRDIYGECLAQRGVRLHTSADETPNIGAKMLAEF